MHIIYLSFLCVSRTNYSIFSLLEIQNNVITNNFRFSGRDISESVSNSPTIIQIGINRNSTYIYNEKNNLLHKMSNLKHNKSQRRNTRKRNRRRGRRRMRRRKCVLTTTFSKPMNGTCSRLGTCRYGSDKEEYDPVRIEFLRMSK